MRNFDDWLATFRNSINGYDYYVDFDKVYDNVENIKIELNILNSLIGSRNIEQEFDKIISKYPATLSCIPIILAVRANEIYCQDDKGAFSYNFKNPNQTVEQYKYFLRETGVFNLLENHLINNVYDYCLGIEVGLDSNGRKNRGGHQMEDLLERFIKSTGAEYYKEMYLADIEKRWGVNLSAISAEGTSTKRWDFVVKTKNTIYVIETNFYASSGSKLNEVSRSYKMIAEEARSCTGVEFVWVTDGAGWKKAKKNLHETFDILPFLFNIADLENGVLSKLFSE